MSLVLLSENYTQLVLNRLIMHFQFDITSFLYCVPIKVRPKIQITFKYNMSQQKQMLLYLHLLLFI